eukprot:7199464-Prymnesium_polylepis.1
MGHSSDRLADRFGVSRADQDAFALRSHHNAAKAHEAGIYDDEIIPFNGSIAETGAPPPPLRRAASAARRRASSATR